MATATLPPPKQEQLVSVRSRKWNVNEVAPSSLPTEGLRVGGDRETLLTLSSTEEIGDAEEKNTQEENHHTCQHSEGPPQGPRLVFIRLPEANHSESIPEEHADGSEDLDHRLRLPRESISRLERQQAPHPHPERLSLVVYPQSQTCT